MAAAAFAKTGQDVRRKGVKADLLAPCHRDRDHMAAAAAASDATAHSFRVRTKLRMFVSAVHVPYSEGFWPKSMACLPMYSGGRLAASV